MAAAKTAVLPAVTVSAAGWLLIDGGAGERGALVGEALGELLAVVEAQLSDFIQLAESVADGVFVHTEPLPGLKTGGIGVKAVRDLAKRMGSTTEHLGPVVHLALGLGLVASAWALLIRVSGPWLSSRYA